MCPAAGVIFVPHSPSDLKWKEHLLESTTDHASRGPATLSELAFSKKNAGSHKPGTAGKRSRFRGIASQPSFPRNGSANSEGCTLSALTCLSDAVWFVHIHVFGMARIFGPPVNSHSIKWRVIKGRGREFTVSGRQFRASASSSKPVCRMQPETVDPKSGRCSRKKFEQAGRFGLQTGSFS